MNKTFCISLLLVILGLGAFLHVCYWAFTGGGPVGPVFLLLYPLLIGFGAAAVSFVILSKGP